MSWPITTAAGSVDVNSGALVLPSGWCKIVNLADLWLPDGNTRGRSVLIPGVAGRDPRPRRVDESTWSLTLLVRGDVVHDASTPASTPDGMQQNIAELYSQLKPVATGDGTRVLELTAPDGSTTWTVDVYSDLIAERIAPNQQATLTWRITCPSGPIVT